MECDEKGGNDFLPDGGSKGASLCNNGQQCPSNSTCITEDGQSSCVCERNGNEHYLMFNNKCHLTTCIFAEERENCSSHGQCIFEEKSNAFRCNCAAGYEGEQCETCAEYYVMSGTKCISKESNYLMISLVSSGGLLIVVIICFVLYKCIVGGRDQKQMKKRDELLNGNGSFMLYNNDNIIYDDNNNCSRDDSIFRDAKNKGDSLEYISFTTKRTDVESPELEELKRDSSCELLITNFESDENEQVLQSSVLDV